MSKISTKSCNPQPKSARKQIRSWVRQENSRLLFFFGVAAFLVLFYGIPYSSLRGKSVLPAIIGGAVAIVFVFFLLPCLLGTKFMIKYSAIGRQFKSFGDFDTVYNEILVSLQSPLYTNGTEFISEKYIFLMTELANAPQSPAFQKNEKLLILPVEWLTRVSIKPNEPYPDEMNTVLFRTKRPPANATSQNCLYTMTIHMDADETARLVDAITANMQSDHSAKENFTSDTGSGHFAEEHFASDTSSGRFAEENFTSDAGSGRFAEEHFASDAQSFASKRKAAANAYPFQSTRTPAARSAARFRSNPLRELRAGKMRVFRLVVSLIVLVNVGSMLFLYFLTDNHTLLTLPKDFVRFIRRDVLNDPQALAFLLGLLAFYLIPMITIYVMIQLWYRGFLEQYEKLPQTEQQELLAKLCDNFETGQPAVIYTGRCFCFRDARRFSFQVLLPYSSVLWIYRSHSFFQINHSVPGSSTEVDFYRLIVRTKNKKKYTIPSGDEPKLSVRVPDAIVGYGDVQREMYLDKVRGQKQ